MRYGICHLSLVPVYEAPDTGVRMGSQLLYGECFKVLESRKFWHRIRMHWDGFEGWILDGQFTFLDEEPWTAITNGPTTCTSDLIGQVFGQKQIIIPVLLGSETGNASTLGHEFEGEGFSPATDKDTLIETALMYLNSPELSGGRSPFGIDASGLTQMVYKCHGLSLKRTAAQQALQGNALSFIEESTPGDLAFFDSSDGSINHVGIILPDNYIIHAYGHVRIDRIDHTGIFNTDLRRYTHPLRVIKQLT
ncbi:MAG: hypothetical protein RLZZ241_1334 [Bacteroidota bacterium]|jgi:hypothetical protein